MAEKAKTTRTRARKPDPAKAKAERIEAAQAKADEGATPAQRATKLTAAEARFPELQDPAWVKGNAEHVQALKDKA